MLADIIIEVLPGTKYFVASLDGKLGILWPLFELPHDKTNKMAYAPREDSDKAGHAPSQSRVFACAQCVAEDPSFLHGNSEDSDQTGRMTRLI